MTTTALEKRPGHEIVVGNLTRDQVALIKRTIAVGFTNDELQLFLFQAERKGLDPLSREIYAFKGSDGRIQIITGIDGFRSRADATGDYLPGRPPTFEFVNDKLVSATAYVMRWDAKTGQWHEVAATAWLEEQERSAPVWHKMPRVMLAKCAEAIAFRRAFPSQLGGLYVAEEMEQREPVPVVIEQAERVAEPSREAALKAPAVRPVASPEPVEPPPPPPPEEPPAESPGEPQGEPNPPGVDDEPAPGRKRAKCGVCGALKYGVSGGQCPACKEAATAEPEAARVSCSACGAAIWEAQADERGRCGPCAVVAKAKAAEPKYPDNLTPVANPGPPASESTPPARPSTATTGQGEDPQAARARWIQRLRELAGEGYFIVGEGTAAVKEAGLVESAEGWTEELADEAIRILEELADRNGRKARS